MEEVRLEQGREEDAGREGVAKCQGVHCATFFTVAMQQFEDGVVLLAVAGKCVLWVFMYEDFVELCTLFASASSSHIV